MYDEDLTNLEEWLRRLKVEYDIFFNGHRKKPPDDLRIKLERLAKKLGEASDMSLQQRFRYNTLVARYYVYKDFWRRTLQSREAADEEESLAAERPEGQTGAAPAGRFELQVSLRNPEAEEQHVRRLYEGFRSARTGRAADSQDIPFDRFLSYLVRQTEEIRRKYECDRVVFTLSVDEAAVRFKARPEPAGT